MLDVLPVVLPVLCESEEVFPSEALPELVVVPVLVPLASYVVDVVFPDASLVHVVMVLVELS